MPLRKIGRPKGAKNKRPLNPGTASSIYFDSECRKLVKQARARYRQLSVSKIVCYAIRFWLAQGAPLHKD